MNVLKNPSFFRPSSRPSSPAPPAIPARPESSQGVERASRPLTKLSLSNFMRQSPSPSPAPRQAPLVQDGSYLEMLSLKLSEAVTKALAQPAGPPASTADLVAGKRPIPQGRGLALGSLIASELNAAHDNPHVYRAVLRSLQRPLTVMLTNLSGVLLPLLASASFLAIPTVTQQFPFPNSVQAHAISVAKFCEELLQVFDELALGLDSDARGDGLRSIRDGLVSLIKRVSNPLIGAVRGEMIPLMETLENPNNVPLPRPAAVSKISVTYHPSIVALQTLMPIYTKALTACTSSSVSHATLASLLISVLWKAMVSLSHRVDLKPSPALTPESSPLLSVKKRRGSPTSTTPPVTPPPSRFAIKLPPSRPPSPPPVALHATADADCKALYNLLVGLPRPSDAQESTKLAREAVDEAFEGLRTLPALLQAAKARPDVLGGSATSAKELNKLTTEIPSLIALPVILHALGGPGTSSVAALLGITDDEYRKACLSGFSRAEECAEAICQRVLEVLQADPVPNDLVIQWLEMELAEMEDLS